MAAHSAVALKAAAHLSSGLLSSGIPPALPGSPLFIIAARHFSLLAAPATPAPFGSAHVPVEAKRSSGSIQTPSTWVGEFTQHGLSRPSFSVRTAKFHVGSVFEAVSPILKEEAFKNTQGARVYASSAKPQVLQQGVTLDSTAATATVSKEKTEAKARSSQQVERELREYDYWGIRRKQRLREDGTPWQWNSFLPTDAYQSDLSVDLNKHWPVKGPADWVALRTVRFLRFWADLLFQKRWGCRAVMLETVAAVPGMVAGALLHCKSLRRMEHSGGWIKALLEEAENERMHLMTFVEITKPKLWERGLVFAVQGVFFNAYFVAYILWPKVCHRIVGYLEEEAVVSYTHYLEAIDAGKIENGPAPAIAIDYWKLPKDARLRDVVLAVRADEAHHRDVNHFAANIKAEGKELKESPAPIGYH